MSSSAWPQGTEPRTRPGASLTSLQDWMAMYSAKIFLALETILDWDLIFLYSSHASQNSRFSSLNSVRRKALKAASPSAGQTHGSTPGQTHSSTHRGAT